MSPLVEAEQISESLRSWLLDQAYPAWWSHGADHVRGGFHERLQQDGLPTGEPRRSRLHPRQIYSFALAQDLAWSGPAVSALSHALKFYLLHYRRADGLFLAVVNADGTVGDASAFLYDQAFALLGLAFACKSLGDKSLRDDARGLLDAIRLHLGHSHGGFDEIPSGTLPLLSNSHMHLFEAALAWFEQDADPRWKHLAEEIVSLATTRFIDRDSGFLLEFFDANWRPVGPHGQRRVEPGHQFEWAWLLLRWSRHSGDLQARQLALQLIDAAENRGVDRSRRVAVNALTSNGAVLDGNARLWPQRAPVATGGTPESHAPGRRNDIG
ncbi:MAG: AGE family epimerase/isomerase [Steroidobacteraceae bacterium]